MPAQGEPETNGGGGLVTPTVGQTMRIAIVNSPTRTTLFPDNAVVAGPSPMAVEIAFLRNEFIIPYQDVEVISEDAETITANVMAGTVIAQVWDIGHVRLPTSAAVDLAANVLLHVVRHSGQDPDAILSRLKASFEIPPIAE